MSKASGIVYFIGAESGDPELMTIRAQRLLKQAQKQRRVVRLKGGDSFIFGRGSEEASYLARHGVTFGLAPASD